MRETSILPLQVMTRDLLSLNSRLQCIFPLCPVILYIVSDCDRYGLVYVILCSYVFLTVWQDCVFIFVLFCFVCFVGLMDMSSMEEDQIVHDATQVVGSSGASFTMMGLHDVLRNIEQMLAPFKRYIKASKAVWHKLFLWHKFLLWYKFLLCHKLSPLLKPLMYMYQMAMQRLLSLSCRRSLMGLDQSILILYNKSISSCGFILLVILMTLHKWLS
jgi:hypothetical protein